MKLRFRPEADAELVETRAYFNEISAGLGDRFVREVRETTRLILRFPTGSSFTVRRPYRKRRVKRFQYGLVYRVLDREIVIVAVAHHARHTDYWLNRVRDAE